VSEFKIVCEIKGENAQGPAAAPEITCALKIAGAAKLLARWSSQRNTLLFLSRCSVRMDAVAAGAGCGVYVQASKDGALARQEQSPVNKMLTKRAHKRQ
jgi:hypothetical protein